MKKYIFLLSFLLTSAVKGQDFTFCAGSCADLRDDSAESIFLQIAKEDKQFFLWLGDNLYFNKEDWQTGASMRAAYEKRFSTAPVRALLQSSHQLAILDDHDFGPNDADSSFEGRRASLQVFSEFWMETPTQVMVNHDTRWTERHGDVLMIGLDDRAHRGPVGTVVLGSKQLNWLSRTLEENKDARVVFIAVGSQVLNDAQVFENYSRFPEEREAFLKICSQADMPVVFVTGDRHHGEINQKKVNGVWLTEVTTSPLTSTTHNPSKEELKANTSLLKNTVVDQAHFARITWNEKGHLDVHFVNKEGEIIMNKSLNLLPM
ncbi:MAG: alkaline phosphatase family protein [Cryomorphaceae bacterium]|nr:alkaline phosphatase family protein [Cryomorphaceae bacterium]